MEKKILLNDILNLLEEDLKITKIRLNTWSGEKNPLEVFKKNPKDLLKWNFYNTTKRSYNNTKYSIGLVNMGNDRWLLFTVAEITKDLKLVGQVGYEYKEINKYKPFFGRVIVKYKNSSQNMIRHAVELIKEIEVIEILHEEFTGKDFSGYDNVCLSYTDLKIAMERNNTYINAFKNQKAVYLITDTSNGKLYVGSATAENEMLYDRWSSYISNGHGKNKELEAIINDISNGFEYIKKYFQYTIIENYNQRVNDSYVLKRESYWKKVLCSKEYGYNRN